ncbi:MAG: ABA4-like family protein [Flavobacteriales bacterium]
MNYALLFKIANVSVVPAWLLLIILPRHKITTAAVHSYLYPAVLGVLYTVLMVVSWGGEGGMDSLENLKLSFGRDEILVLGWVHYLVFDLFIGAWIVRDSKSNGIAHWKIIPSLLFTLFAGPIGLLSYLFLRGIYTKKLTL